MEGRARSWDVQPTGGWEAKAERRQDGWRSCVFNIGTGWNWVSNIRLFRVVGKLGGFQDVWDLCLYIDAISPAPMEGFIWQFPWSVAMRTDHGDLGHGHGNLGHDHTKTLQRKSKQYPIPVAFAS